MFIGFIAVVIILLVIVVLMSTGTLSGTQNSQYITESKKVVALLSHLKNESKFYYSKNETFEGIDMSYFDQHNFASDLMKYDTLTDTEWSGWPIQVASPYTGPSIAIGGTAGDNIRIIVASDNNGQNAGFYMIKRISNPVNPDFNKVLEKTLSEDTTYIGGW